MLDVLADQRGDRLDLDAYDEDFTLRFERMRGADAWKLERIQAFHQPENPSWMRYRSGGVQESLRMLEEDRSELTAMFSELDRRGSRVMRVRVVEWPLTPYLYWELHSLRVRAQCGEHIRVIGPQAVSRWEERDTLPEVLTLGTDVTYRIRYDGQGVLSGCVRYTDPEVTASCQRQITALYRDAEPLEPYFTREVAPTEAPRA